MSQAALLALCGACVAGLLLAEQRQWPEGRWLFKPAASVVFVALAVLGGGLSSDFGIALTTGLTLCAVGDVLLIPHRRWGFVAGMGAFALGHGAYIAAFIIGGAAPGAAMAAAGLLVAVLAIAVIWPLRPGLGPLAAPVAAYGLIIAAMAAAAAAYWQAGGPNGAVLLAAALAFAVSDVAVARDQFARPSFANKMWGLPLYYVAQCLFALSV